MARRAKEETEAANALVRLEEAKQAIQQGVYSYDGRKWKNAGELVTLIKDQAAAMLDNVLRYRPEVVPEDVEQIIARKDKEIRDLRKANASAEEVNNDLRVKIIEAMDRAEELEADRRKAADDRQIVEEQRQEIAALQIELAKVNAELCRTKEKLNKARDITIPTWRRQFQDMAEALEVYTRGQSRAAQRTASRIRVMNEALRKD